MAKVNTIVLKIVNVLFWVMFIGLCIKTGALLVSFIVSLFVSDAAARDLYLGLNLSDVYHYSKVQYIMLVSVLLLIQGMKAYIALLIVRFFLNFRLSKPFDGQIAALFTRISYIALGTGVLALLAKQYSKRLMDQGLRIPIEWGGEEILFFAGVIYLLAEIFRKGTELQAENDLTV